MILDIIPAAVIILLIVSFVRTRSLRRREEMELREIIRSFKEEAGDE